MYVAKSCATLSSECIARGAITIRIFKVIIILLLAMLMAFSAFACDSASEDSYEPLPEEIHEPQPEPEVDEPLPYEVGDDYETDYETEADYDVWDFENFADVREASFYTGLPHGYIAVGFIEYMSDNFAGRSPFTYRERETAVWIIEELLAMGHDWENISVQEFTYEELIERDIGVIMPPRWDLISSVTILGAERFYQLRQDRGSQNVILTMPGQSESKIIVGAHYDSVPYPGASDNASGVALLLESAQRMMEIDHYHTIVYVFFGAEEVGLFGAYIYYYSLTAEEHGNVVMMINADVLIEGPYIIYGTGTAPQFDDDTAEIVAGALVELFVGRTFEAVGDVFSAEYFEEWTVNLTEHFAANPEWTVIQGLREGLVDTVETDTSLRVDAIAAELNYAHDFELLAIPEGIAFPSDNLAFFMSHTVVNLVGLERVENIDGERIPMGNQIHNDFAATILHSPLDEFNHIEYLWPGMMLANMNAFGLFIEAILTAVFE